MRQDDAVAVCGYWAILVLGVVGVLGRVYLTIDQVGFRSETLPFLISQTAFDLAIVIGLFVIVRILIQRRHIDEPEFRSDEDASD